MKIGSTRAIAMPLLPSFFIQVVCHVFAPNDSRLTSHIIQRRSMQMQMQMQCKPQALPMSNNLSISHTRLHISKRWILRTTFVASIPRATATTSLSLLRATHPCTLRHRAPPPLVHGWHHWLGSTRLPRASAPSYNAAKDGKQQKSANATAYSNDEVTIVMNPATDFFGSG